MSRLLQILVGLIATLHISFMFIEMFLWTKPLGLKVFGQSLEKAKSSQTLAANQGLYNGFLAAGLIWSLLHPSAEIANHIQLFFLVCVATAGLYGGYSVNKKIILVQAAPALAALILLLML